MRPRKIYFIVLLLIFSLSYVNAMKLAIKNTAPNPSSNKITLHLNNMKQIIELDSTGMATVELFDFEPQYALVFIQYWSKILYLEPDKDLAIEYELYRNISFKGENADINQYLSSEIASINSNDAELNEAAYLEWAQRILERNLARMNAHGFADSFKENERKRLIYYSFVQLPDYSAFYYTYWKKAAQITDSYFNFLKKYLVFDSSLLSMPNYQDYLFKSINLLLYNEVQGEHDSKALLHHFFVYAEKNIDDEKVKAYLVDRFVRNFIEESSVNYVRFPGLEATYRKHVKDADMLAGFEHLIASINELKEGSLSPLFSYKDLDGKLVSLESLKGNLVYIDVWASWCAPCRSEFSHLRKLEAKFRDKDIYFVSISCDEDISAWRKSVDHHQLGGIQLHFGGDDSFLQAYKVKGIPRFILLDKEGNIVSANMTRPSNPETEARINELLE